MTSKERPLGDFEYPILTYCEDCGEEITIGHFVEISRINDSGKVAVQRIVIDNRVSYSRSERCRVSQTGTHVF